MKKSISSLVVEHPTLWDQSDTLPRFNDEASSTFADNVALPIHRWFKYSAGFSALWVRDVILRERANGREKILDPFAGSGTVLLESEVCGLEASGVEAHPFVARVAKAKLYWAANPQEFSCHAQSLLAQAKKKKGNTSHYPLLIQRCFSEDTLTRLDMLRQSWQDVADGSPSSELNWLALASILRECSPVGTAQWQYILPNKTKVKAADPFEAFARKVAAMTKDMSLSQERVHSISAVIYAEDARLCSSVSDGWADLVITSPPYANNYDYADATRLEMSFFGEIQGWGDLQESVRKYLIRSCTQHVAKQTKHVEAILESPELEPIRFEIKQVCHLLDAERLNHGGNKPYHTMIAAYFQDMSKVWTTLRRVTKSGASICFVIGDSAPYGVYAPIDKWMGELAVAAGFKSYRFEKVRDRNVKWKNRKHTVPLHEGRLWVEG